MLNIEHLTAGYGALTVLHDVSLNVKRGEAVAIVGANGAGKTTLVRAVCGLIKPTAGAVEMNGVELTRRPAHDRPQHGVAVLLENRRLFGEFTVTENLRLAREAGEKHRGDRKQFTQKDIDELFPMIPERANTRVELLSGGQQQIVAIARALLLQPDLLILDEPSTGLAPKVVKDILRVLRQLRERGMAMLLVEQDVHVAVDITDRAYVMSLGRMLHQVEGQEWRDFASDERLAAAYLGTSE